MFWVPSAWAGSEWPSLDRPSHTGGGEADAVVIVGIEDYLLAPDVPGARQNARDWYTWFTSARGTPADHVRLLVDQEATREAILEAARGLPAAVGPEGTVWIVYIGHGAPSADGRDGLLLGVDTQQTASSVTARSVPRSELSAAAGAVAPLVMVLDACFSGRDPSGAMLVPGLQPMVPNWAVATGPEVVLSAAASDQFAGPLPGTQRPAFSYLTLGALQGWGDADADGAVTASEALAWSDKALRATLTDRSQVPQRSGVDRPLSLAGKTKAPDLAELRLAAPAVVAMRPPATPTVGGSGLGIDVELETAYGEALEVERRPMSTPTQVRDAWCRVSRIRGDQNAYREVATTTCAEWYAYDTGIETALRDLGRNYEDLRKLMPLDTVDQARKLAATDQALATYGTFPQGRIAIRQLQQARDRLAAGGSPRLPPFEGPHPHELRGAEHGIFFAGWDPVLLKFPIQFLSLGYVVEPGYDAAPEVSLAGFQVGPVDLGMFVGNGLGDNIGYRFRAGFAPFAVRPSRRHPGELRGSFLNPAVGAGFSVGKREVPAEQTSLAATTGNSPGTVEVNATWFDLYAANSVFLTNVFGVRGEFRQPLVRVGAESQDVRLNQQFMISLVLSPASLM